MNSGLSLAAPSNSPTAKLKQLPVGASTAVATVNTATFDAAPLDAASLDVTTVDAATVDDTTVDSATVDAAAVTANAAIIANAFSDVTHAALSAFDIAIAAFFS